MQRVVRLGNGKQVTLSGFVAAWKRVLAVDPATEYKHGLRGHDPAKASEILRDFRKGMHDRINRRVPGFGHTLRPETRRGRKDCSDWYWLMWRTSRELNSRHAIHWLPFELRERFAHRLSEAY